ncbi:MAG: beta-N-acetylhexosaminidase [Rickettsiales bacterium]|nr:beta-N-acetylhexosaminidase [Rickettsiales bacterium]
MPNPKALIFGCEGLQLTAEERRFFTSAQPYGFILFARNIESPEQVAALVADLKNTVSHSDVPVLIDQEGGRVARLRPPHWKAYPPAGVFAQLWADDPEKAKRAAYLNHRIMADELHALGINVDCAPVLDIYFEDAHDIVGDRAFGDNAEQVAALGRAVMDGLLDGGVLPVIKHIPGHGRANADSHEALPVVNASRIELETHDFTPFKALNDAPMGMTAHIQYTSLDGDYPATLSPRVIAMIRREIGFDGLLMCDDISMKALKGHLTSLAGSALVAGCDLVLHCNGTMEEMRSLADVVPEMSLDALRRSDKAFGLIQGAVKPFDLAKAEAEWQALLSEADKSSNTGAQAV